VKWGKKILGREENLKAKRKLFSLDAATKAKRNAKMTSAGPPHDDTCRGRETKKKLKDKRA